MNGVQMRGLQAGYKCITLYMGLWLLLLIIIIIIIIIIVVNVFQLKQSAIYKAGADWLSLRSMSP